MTDSSTNRICGLLRPQPDGSTGRSQLGAESSNFRYINLDINFININNESVLDFP